MPDHSLTPSHKRRCIGAVSLSTSPPRIAASSSNITIDLTHDDDEEAVRQSFQTADSKTMSCEDDEALARALQEEYDQLGSESLHVQPDASLPKPVQNQDDEEYARQLQAHFDIGGLEEAAEPSDLQHSFVDSDEAFARMLQDQEDRYEDSDDIPVSSLNPISVPPLENTTHEKTASGDDAMTSEFTQPTSEPSLQAKEVEQAVHGFAKHISALRCANCGRYNLRADKDVLAVSQSFLGDAIGSQVMTCPKCNKPDTQKDRITLIWTLLCGFDVKSNANRPDKKKKSSTSTSTLSGGKSALGSGTGYGGHRNHSSRKHESYSNPIKLAPSSKTPQDQDDVMTSQVFGILTELLPSYERESPFDLDPPRKTLQALFMCSSILERAAELFRNNSLDDVTSKKGLYSSLVRFVQTLANHHATSPLVFGDRVVRSSGTGVLKVTHGKEKLVSTDVTDTTQPLTKCLTDLASQCTMMLRSSDSDPEDLQILQAIRELHDFLEANVGSMPGKSFSDGDTAWTKMLAVSEVPDEHIISHHGLASKESTIATIVPGRMKRIMQEIAGLQASLPEGIYFRYASSRPDISKFLIVGPKDTPYENGLFEFDMLCDANFPNGPPQVKFRTTGGGFVAFNPNLYSNGKVCLSLLGTWSGEPWQPNKSTLLQVLVSIQAMILCEKPWYNEPGRESVPSDQQSQSYNRGLYSHTVQTAMIDWLERRRYGTASGIARRANAGTIDTQEGIWDEIVRKHFKVKQNEIVSTVGKWVADVTSAGAAPRPHGTYYSPEMPAFTSSAHGVYTPPPYQAYPSNVGQQSVPPFGSYSGNNQVYGHPNFGAAPHQTYAATSSFLTGQSTASQGTGWQGRAPVGFFGAPLTSATSATPAPIAAPVAALAGNDLLQKLRGAMDKLRSNAASSRTYH